MNAGGGPFVKHIDLEDCLVPSVQNNCSYCKLKEREIKKRSDL